MVALEVRLAVGTKIPEIIEVWRELMAYHATLDPKFFIKEDAHLDFGKFVEDLINSDDSEVFVALENGQVVGYAITRISEYPPVFQVEKYGEICDLAVRSKFQRKGIGEQILNKVFEWFKSKDINRVELRVSVKNEKGYSFWKKHGFRDYIHILYVER